MTWMIVGITGIVVLVARHEYSDWAPRLTAVLVRMAAVCHPESIRMREEWEAEMAAIRGAESDAVGLVHASGLFLRYGLTAPFRLTDPLHLVFSGFFIVVYRGSWWSWLVPVALVAGFAGFDRFRLSRPNTDDETPTERLYWPVGKVDRVIWFFALATVLHSNLKEAVARADLLGAVLTVLWVSCVFLP